MNKKRVYIICLSLILMLALSACGAPEVPGVSSDMPEVPGVEYDPEADADIPIVTPDGDDTSVMITPEERPHYSDANGTEYVFKTEGKYISIYDGEGFKPTYLNGVNIGSGTPGFFPGELAIEKKAYLRWFEQIADMNCNCIRIYTTMKPEFYEAFYQYNNTTDKKLYLIMGVWYDEDKVIETGDAYEILEGAVDEAKEQIDIIHGDCKIEKRPGKAYGSYDKDVSDYVLGWILGIESDAVFVGTTNEKHPDITSYDGEYLSVEDTDAFHAFLCELGDETIKYETEKYGMQRPVSWANWPTADAMSHPDEPLFEREDAVSINVECIKPKENFEPGIFASYHVYPYYPDFMMIEDKYVGYRDESGNINTYKAYLEDLMSLHNIPVMVAEFGVPSSRGVTHANPYNHYDQGHLSEKAQGEALSSMAQDIYDCGYCGGIVFTWQDEWFKRTWNTMDYTDSDRRPFWSDIQTSEQNFGLMAFDPGISHPAAVIDGNFKDWQGESPLAEIEGRNLYVKKDERYIYFCIKGDGLDPENEHLVIPVDITPKSGSDEYKDISFDRDADFVIDLNGKTDSRVLVHAYYDRYALVFAPYDDIYDATGKDDKNNKEFVPIYLCLNRTQTIPTTGEVRHAEHIDTGLLKYGNGDPADPSGDTLSDFIYGDGFVEIRIPWGVLNFRDPSTKEVEDDFWQTGELSGVCVDEIYLGLCAGEKSAPMASYTWDNWDEPEYHERLKQSYDILKERFGKLVIN